MSIPNKDYWPGKHKDRITLNKTDVQKEVDNEKVKWDLPKPVDESGWDMFFSGFKKVGDITGVSGLLEKKGVIPKDMSNTKSKAIHSDGYAGDYPNNADKVSYNSMMNASTYLDDILYGLPRGEPIGLNYYKRIQKCKYRNKKKTDPPAPWKYMYVRTKPKGDALWRMGIGSEETEDNGLIFSVLEDLLDLNPFRLARMGQYTKKGSTAKDYSKYTNCTTTNIHPGNIGFYDQHNNKIKNPPQDTIEMFNNQYGRKSKNSKYIFTSLFILLILIVLYKLMK